jgi:riboflavin kinase/FMN adenylyltransferase
MDIVTDPSTSVPPLSGSAVTIGAYDGVHLGHRALLAELRARGTGDGLTVVVVTFDRHPATVVRPDSAPALLCDLDQKLELLASAGVDRTVVIPFTEERANETAEDFVSTVLVGALDARLVVVGQDFHFGHGRKGNVALLAELGSTAGFVVEGVTLSTDSAGATPISSTRIRQLVANRQRGCPRRHLPAGRRHLCRMVRTPRRHGVGGGHLGRPPTHLLRGRG